MSLSAREQQALDTIEHRLAGADPKLASLLATFTRLNSGEEMPVRERIQANQQLGGWFRVAGRHAARRPARRAPRAARACRRLGWRRALALWLLVVAALVAAAAMISRGQPRACVPWWVVSCARQASADRFRSSHPPGSHVHNGGRGPVHAQPGGWHPVNPVAREPG